MHFECSRMVGCYRPVYRYQFLSWAKCSAREVSSFLSRRCCYLWAMLFGCTGGALLSFGNLPLRWAAFHDVRACWKSFSSPFCARWSASPNAERASCFPRCWTCSYVSLDQLAAASFFFILPAMRTVSRILGFMYGFPATVEIL